MYFNYFLNLILHCRSGKTSIIKRFIGENFESEYSPTTSPNYSVQEVKTKDRQVLLQVWEIPGHDQYLESFSGNFYRDFDCCLLLYDVTNSNSFQSLGQWLNEFTIQANPRSIGYFPVIVVGTKSDQNQNRQVSRLTAEKWCVLQQSSGNGFFSHMEVTATKYSQIDYLFKQVARHVVRVEMAMNSVENRTALEHRQMAMPNLHCCCCCNIL